MFHPTRTIPEGSSYVRTPFTEKGTPTCQGPDCAPASRVTGRWTFANWPAKLCPCGTVADSEPIASGIVIIKAWTL